MERLYTANRLWEASLLRDLLAEGGVQARIVNEHFQLTAQVPLYETLPEVWVVDANDPTVKAIFDKYLKQKEQTEPGERRCSTCGEESPANFEVCWKCRWPF